MELGVRQEERPRCNAGAGEGEGVGEGEGEDRLSELPDELLHEILDRVDSFTATSTALLSRRWRQRDPCRWLTAFDFPVTRFLPPDYEELSAIYGRAKKQGDAVEAEAVAERLVLCERQATEAYVRAVACLLRFPSRFPSIKRIRLEIFLAAMESSETGALVTWCIRSAVRGFRVEHLALDALPGAARVAADGPRTYNFPLDLLDSELDGLRPSRLASLHVTNCTVRASDPSGYRLFHGLTKLAIQHTRGAFCSSSDIVRILALCQRLVTLCLRSCVFVRKSTPLRIDAPPESSLRELIVDGCGAVREMVVDNAPSLEELVVDRCRLNALKIVNAPRLRRLVCRNTVRAPELGAQATMALLHVDIGFLDPGEGTHDRDNLRRFLGGIGPRVEELACSFIPNVYSSANHPDAETPGTKPSV